MHNLSAIKSQFSIFGSDHTSVKDKWIGKYSRKFVVHLVAYMDLIYWSVRIFIRRGWGKGEWYRHFSQQGVSLY